MNSRKGNEKGTGKQEKGLLNGHVGGKRPFSGKEAAIYIAVAAFSFVLYLTSGISPSSVPSEGIRRGDPGAGTAEYTVDLAAEGDLYEGIGIEIPSREYTEQEFYNLVESGKNDLIRKMLSGNRGTDLVTGDLDLSDGFDKMPFEIQWLPGDTSLIDKQGRIICPEPFDTVIYLNIGYRSFSRDFSINLHAEPGIETVRKIQKNRFTSSIQNFLSENAMTESEYVQMPGNVDGKNVTYRFSGKARNPVFLLLGAGTAVCLYAGFKKDRESEAKKRKQKILKELPAVLQKMSMYITSGMTFRNIWILLCDKAGKEGKTGEPIYEEMRISANELKSGISETLVYSGFGERTATPETVRFTALVSQNIITGSTRLTELLRTEAANALAERRQRAVKAGEEAGTRLLAPMMILLAVMLAIIMVPAFMNI